MKPFYFFASWWILIPRRGVLGLGYQNSVTGKEFKAPNRNSGAYLAFLKGNRDSITVGAIETLIREFRGAPRGEGGARLWDRAKRFVDLRAQINWDDRDPRELIANLFNQKHWLETGYATDRAETAALDLALLKEKILALFDSEIERVPDGQPKDLLSRVARHLRQQIATNEPSVEEQQGGLQVATRWGAKGITAEHVYILGVCREALPGQRRNNYPGTDVEYVDEQRRLFSVSITRPKETLVISRALGVAKSEARKLGLTVTTGTGHQAVLQMSPFLHDIIDFLPSAVAGAPWGGVRS
ncbi:MAG: 3'-5' exonuclease [Gemmatimonadaceae bacterium]